MSEPNPVPQRLLSPCSERLPSTNPEDASNGGSAGPDEDN